LNFTLMNRYSLQQLFLQLFLHFMPDVLLAAMLQTCNDPRQTCQEEQEKSN
jgi:hypothetical protein